MPNFTFRHIPLDSVQEFIDRATAELEQAICDATEDHGSCVMGLSGGSTPRPIYEELGKLVAVEWDKVKIFLVDERYVPSSDERSNQRLVRETLLKNAAIAEHQIVFPDTGLDLGECVEEYEGKLEGCSAVSPLDTSLDASTVLSTGTPFGLLGTTRGDTADIVVLGLGQDGHIASLFPGDRDAIMNRDKNVIHTQTDEFDVRDRITVTMPVLESAKHQFFFLKGKGKEKIFDEVMEAEEDPIKYPAHAILKSGRTTWVTCFE